MIEITGIGFPNKGAELMFAAVSERFKELGLESANDFACCTTDVSFQSVGNITSYGVKVIPHVPMVPRKLKFKVIELIPGKILDKLGLAKKSEVKHIIDASGFAYSDQWGASGLEKVYAHYMRVKENGGKIIFLPQAFGPFEKPDVIEWVGKIVNLADLIYAREEVSYGFLESLIKDKKKLLCSTDFTNLVEGYQRKSDKKYNNQFVIVPNSRVLDKGSKKISDNYVALLVKLVEEVERHGRQVVFLNHEGCKDLALINDVIRLLGNDYEILNESDPLRIKGLLGAFEAGFSSRYHGVVSLLSQGVPALCVGWSHKYKELYKDYEASDLLLDQLASDDLQSLSLVVEKLFLNIQDTRKNLNSQSEKLKKNTEQLWENVSKTIASC